jgi:bacterioferritin
MATTAEIIAKLNDIRASEMRMALVYHRCAQLVTGPWRDALADEFTEHAGQEIRHAEVAMRRIIALGGAISSEVKEIPLWNTLEEVLSGLDELEEAGIRSWQSLMEMLPSKDAFRHTIEDVLVAEQHHWDEVKRWRRKEDGRSAKTEAMEQPEQAQPEQVAAEDPTAAEGPSAEEAPQELQEPEEYAGPREEDVVGDARRLSISLIDLETERPDVGAGEAWQSDDGQLSGTGVVAVMLFEPVARQRYLAASLVVDLSPLTILQKRLARASTVRVEVAEEGHGS